jgi:hypothetical protein
VTRVCGTCYRESVLLCGTCYRESVLLRYVVPVTGRVCYYGMCYLLQGECVTTVCVTCYRESVLLGYVLPVTGRVCY